MNVQIFVEPYGKGRYAARLYVKRPDMSEESHVLIGVTETKAEALRLAVGFGDSTVAACVRAVDRYRNETQITIDIRDITEQMAIDLRKY